jgi:hypothetical protein
MIRIGRGVKFEPLKIVPTTEITLQMDENIKASVRRTTGADKPIMAEALGGRTSAREASLIYEQARVPLDAQAEDLSEQIFPWMYERDRRMMQIFADPKLVLAVTYKNQLTAVEPAKLWGPVKIKVTAVDRFRNTVIKRQEINGYLNSTAFPLSLRYMGEKGAKVFFRQIFQWFGWDKYNEIFPLGQDHDAVRVANMENYSMLTAGKWDEPNQNENHEVHLSQHDAKIAEYRLLPDGERDDAKLKMLESHAQVHRNMMAAQNQNIASAASAMQQGQPFGGQPGGVQSAQGPGEVGGMMEEGNAGRMANG